MKGLISFCLWGNKKIYNQGAIDNVKVVSKIYPGWDVRIYIAENSPALSVLSKLDCQLYLVPPPYDYRVALTRFYAASDKSYTHVIFRDTDSILNEKEASAVDEWVKSGKKFHSIKENKEHLLFKVMAGMCGIKTGVFPNIENDIKQWLKVNIIMGIPPYLDQLFLQQVVWRRISNDYLGHGYGMKPFPFSDYTKDIGAIEHEEWRNIPFVTESE